MLSSNDHFRRSSRKMLHARKASKLIVKDIFGDLIDIKASLKHEMSNTDERSQSNLFSPTRHHLSLILEDFSNLEYKISAKKENEGVYRYAVSIHNKTKMVKKWDFTTERPIDLTRAFNSGVTGSDISRIQCTEDQLVDMDKVLPYDVSVKGPLIYYTIPQGSGMSFKYRLDGKDMPELSTLWLLVMSCGRNQIHQNPTYTSSSANSCLRMSSYNFVVLFHEFERYLNRKQTDPSITLEDVTNIDYIKLIFLTIHKIGHSVFSIYEQEFDRVEKRLKKSKKHKSGSLLAQWRFIRNRIELLMSIPSIDILSMPISKIVQLLPSLILRNRGITWQLVISNIVSQALKHIHPLDNRLHNMILSLIPSSTLQLIIDANTLPYDIEVENRRSFWMQFGCSGYLSMLVKDIIKNDSCQIVAVKSEDVVFRIAENVENCVVVFTGVYLLWSSKTLQLYYDDTNTSHLIATMTIDKCMKVIGSHVATSAIYVMVKKDASSYRSMQELRRIAVHGDRTASVMVVEDELSNSWWGMARFDVIVMADVKNNAMKIINIETDDVKIVNRKVYEPPSGECEDKAMSMFHSSASSLSEFNELSIAANNSFFACTFYKFAYPTTNSKSYFFVVSLSKVSRPYIFDENCTGYDYSLTTRQVITTKSGYVASIVLNTRDLRGKIIVFRDGIFQEHIVSKHLAWLKQIKINEDRVKTYIHPAYQPLITFERLRQRFNIWYRVENYRHDVNVRMMVVNVNL